jgi:hypothetical protein
LCAIAEGAIIGTGAIKRIDNRECEMTRMFSPRLTKAAGLDARSQMI